MPVLQGKQYGSHIHVAGIMSLASSSVMGLQHKADGVPQAAIPRRKFIN